MTLCGGVGCYDQLCCPASPKLLLGLDLGLGCDNNCSGWPTPHENNALVVHVFICDAYHHMIWRG